MNTSRFLMAFALYAFCCVAVSASDLLDYLPYYNISQMKNVPFGTRSIIMDNRKFDDEYTQYDYDKDGRLLTCEKSGWHVGWGCVTYFNWSNDGRLLSSQTESHGSDVSYGHTSTKYTTDSQGRIIESNSVNYVSIPPFIDHQKTYDVKSTFTYDDTGNCIKVTIVSVGKDFSYHDNADAKEERKVTEVEFTYNPDGQLVKAVQSTDNGDGKEYSYQTFEYASDDDDYLSRSVYHRPRDFGEGTCIITTDYIPYGDGVPSGYIKQITYQGLYDDESVETGKQMFIFSGAPFNAQSLNDIRNPNIAPNKGEEPLLSFINKFVSDVKFRAERSKGYFIAKSTDCNPMDVIMGYGKNMAAGKIASIQMTDELAAKKFGNYSGKIDLSFDSPISYCRKWSNLSDDMATCYVEVTEYINSEDSYERGFKTKELIEYVFIRTNGRWHLAGAFTPHKIDPYL